MERLQKKGSEKKPIMASSCSIPPLTFFYLTYSLFLMSYLGILAVATKELMRGQASVNDIKLFICSHDCHFSKRDSVKRLESIKMHNPNNISEAHPDLVDRMMRRK